MTTRRLHNLELCCVLLLPPKWAGCWDTAATNTGCFRGRYSHPRRCYLLRNGCDRLQRLTKPWSAASPLTWHIYRDTDGTILLVPPFDPEPGFAISFVDSEYVVLICDPDDMDELGTFETLEAALAGISQWLDLPARMVDSLALSESGLLF